MVKLFVCLFVCLFVVACARPSYQTYEVVPNDARSCVADAKQLNIHCKEQKQILYEQCRTREQVLYQEKLTAFNANKMMVQSQYQQCLDSCLQQTHNGVGVVGTNVIKNDQNYCIYGWSQYNISKDGQCGSISTNLDNLKQPSSESDCSQIYGLCDEEYEISFTRCGGHNETRCVANCDKAK